jgi:plasmid replication initiation protein
MPLPGKQNNNLLEIKKHVNAIHCSNNISLVQRKLFNAFLFHAYQDLPKKSQYKIPVKTLCELIGYDSNDQKKLKNSILALITTAIEWNVIHYTNNDRSKWSASSIIASAKIENGICTYEFSSVMRELLYRPEMYGRVDMHVMSQFKSGYGLALYENCIRFQGLSNTPWISLDIFRKLMGITDSSYRVFCDLKKRVLDIALREVNRLSHLQVTSEIQRFNKKVTNIRFNLASKQNEFVPIENSTDPINVKLTKLLNDKFGLSAESINEILLKYDPDYIQEKIGIITQSDSFKYGKIRELAAYLIDALKKDYKKSKSNSMLVTDSKKFSFESEKQENKILEKRKEQYSKYVSVLIEQYLSSLSEVDKNQLYNKFEQFLISDQYAMTQYKNKGLASAIVRGMFNIFIKNIDLSSKLKILSFEDFADY